MTLRSFSKNFLLSFLIFGITTCEGTGEKICASERERNDLSGVFHQVPRKERSITRKTPSNSASFFHQIGEEADKGKEKAAAVAVAVTNDGKYTRFCDNICRVCDVRFSYSSRLKHHYKTEHPGGKPYGCPQCKKEFTRRNTWVKHAKRRHPETVHDSLIRDSSTAESATCELCHIVLVGANALQNHAVAQHKGMKLMKCSECELRFFWKRSLVSHKIKKHEAEDTSLRCRHCKGYFERSDDLGKHEYECGPRLESFKKGAVECKLSDVGMKERAVECHKCGENFKSVASLKYHFQETHPETKGLFLCDYCGKSFTTNAYLNKHVNRSHWDVVGEDKRTLNYCKYQLFHCDLCGEEFTGIRNYEMHGISAHPEGKLFRCAQCGNGFSWKKALKRHLNAKHGERQLFCPRCGKEFALRSELKVHEKACRQVGKGGKEYFCPICRRTLRGSLKYHLESHTQYDHCGMCEQRFHHYNNPRGLTNHMMMRHPHAFNNLHSLVNAAEIFEVKTERE